VFTLLIGFAQIFIIESRAGWGFAVKTTSTDGNYNKI